MQLFNDSTSNDLARRNFVLQTLLAAPQLFGIVMGWAAIDRVPLAIGCYLAGCAIGLIVAVFALLVCGYANDALQLIGLDEHEV